VNATVVGAILRKDLREFRADRFFVAMTLLSVVLYPVFFWVLPSTVDETLRVGIVQRGLDAVVAGLQTETEGIELVEFATVDAVEAALLGGDDDLVAGLVFPPDFVAAASAGETSVVALLVTADVPPEVESALSAVVSELALVLLGDSGADQLLSEPVVLGEDMVGDQVSLREQLRPLLAFFVLIVETFALATLVASEIAQRTVTAVLVTPATRADFLAAKGLVGTGIAFTEATVIMLLIGGFTTGAPIMLLTLLLGAALVTGVGMVIGTYAKDFMGVLFLSVLAMVPLLVPAFAALFPGTAATWVQAMPSYGFVQTVVEVSAQGAGWSQVAPDLLALAAWTVAAFAGGWVVLGRRVGTL
jgi:ABC-2 type transport system permease protein